MQNQDYDEDEGTIFQKRELKIQLKKLRENNYELDVKIEKLRNENFSKTEQISRIQVLLLE